MCYIMKRESLSTLASNINVKMNPIDAYKAQLKYIHVKHYAYRQYHLQIIIVIIIVMSSID